MLQGRYKTHNTPSALGGLTDGILTTLRVDDKEDRRLVIASIKKAGFRTHDTLKDPVNAKEAALEKAGSSVGIIILYLLDLVVNGEYV